jgi:TRAP-type C4-dicarboxylate transport system permease small subunit
MKTYSRIAAIVFGLMMTALCVVIAAETILRKLFATSLGGIDELSGYAIAIGAPLCFTVAAVEQSHIRINLIHMKLPKPVQAILNAVAAVTLALLAIYLVIFTVRTVAETQMFGSIAQTPWATPLIWPQTLWLGSMAVFTLAACLLAVRAVFYAVTGRRDDLLRAFGPDSVEDELQAELSDLEARA